MAVRRRAVDAWTLLAAVAATAVTAGLAVTGAVAAVEQAAFRLVNGWPDAWYRPLLLVQYAGVLGAPLVVAAAAVALRRWRLALGLALLVPLKLLVEREVLKVLVPRGRPGATIPDAVLRDVPVAGPAFPSGHAVVAFGVAVLLAPYLSRPWRRAVLAAAVAIGLSRVYLGAHAPLDVLGGAAAGTALGAGINLLLGVPAPAGERAGRPGS